MKKLLIGLIIAHHLCALSDCSICLDPILPVHTQVTTSCLKPHTFHEPCLAAWYDQPEQTNSHKCPECRHPFSRPLKKELNAFNYEYKEREPDWQDYKRWGLGIGFVVIFVGCLIKIITGK